MLEDFNKYMRVPKWAPITSEKTIRRRLIDGNERWCLVYREKGNIVVRLADGNGLNISEEIEADIKNGKAKNLTKEDVEEELEELEEDVEELEGDIQEDKDPYIEKKLTETKEDIVEVESDIERANDTEDLIEAKEDIHNISIDIKEIEEEIEE